jgi:hypothetical protein
MGAVMKTRVYISTEAHPTVRNILEKMFPDAVKVEDPTIVMGRIVEDHLRQQLGYDPDEDLPF